MCINMSAVIFFRTINLLLLTQKLVNKKEIANFLETKMKKKYVT